MSKPELTETQRNRVEAALSAVPFARLLGIQVDSIEAGRAALSLQIRDEFKQNNGVVHGGVIAALIDSATASAILTLLEPAERTTTVDLTISYLRPLVSGAVVATARVVREGRRLIVASADLTDSAGNLAATALSTYIRLSRDAASPPNNS